MIKILEPLAAPVCASAGLSGEAQALVTPQQTPAQYVAALEQNGLQQDACKFMAYGMSEKDAVCYATKSAKSVADLGNTAEQEAIAAAEAWMKAPGEATQKAASEAAAKAGYESPAAWAAQAAAWAKSPTAPQVAVPGVSSLTSHAAFGAVQLAAASPAERANAVSQMAEARANAAAQKAAAEAKAAAGVVPAVPEVKTPVVTVPQTPQVADATAAAKAKVSKAYQPYCDLGKQIANGQTTCV